MHSRLAVYPIHVKLLWRCYHPGGFSRERWNSFAHSCYISQSGELLRIQPFHRWHNVR